MAKYPIKGILTEQNNFLLKPKRISYKTKLKQSIDTHKIEQRQQRLIFEHNNEKMIKAQQEIPVPKPKTYLRKTKKEKNFYNILVF